MSRQQRHSEVTAPAAMASAWQWRRLTDFCIGIFDCPHSTPNLTTAGPLLARSQDIRFGFFDNDDAARVSEETYNARTERAAPAWGDLLFSREGTYFGIAAEVPRDVKVCLGQRMVLIRPNPEILDFRFLRYWLNSPLLVRHLLGYHDGSVAQRLNLATIRGLPVPLMGLGEQQAISRVLGALDDKIDLNRALNQTLEAMAWALFRSWFVDFDPVIAKADGDRPFGMDAETAALFPDRFVESELGPIPTGWQIATLMELARFVNGQNFTRNATGTGRMVLRIAELNSGPGSSTVYNPSLFTVPAQWA